MWTLLCLLSLGSAYYRYGDAPYPPDFSCAPTDFPGLYIHVFDIDETNGLSYNSTIEFVSPSVFFEPEEAKFTNPFIYLANVILEDNQTFVLSEDNATGKFNTSAGLQVLYFCPSDPNTTVDNPMEGNLNDCAGAYLKTNTSDMCYSTLNMSHDQWNHTDFLGGAYPIMDIAAPFGAGVYQLNIATRYYAGFASGKYPKLGAGFAWCVRTDTAEEVIIIDWSIIVSWLAFPIAAGFVMLVSCQILGCLKVAEAENSLKGSGSGKKNLSKSSQSSFVDPNSGFGIEMKEMKPASAADELTVNPATNVESSLTKKDDSKARRGSVTTVKSPYHQIGFKQSFPSLALFGLMFISTLYLSVFFILFTINQSGHIISELWVREDVIVATIVFFHFGSFWYFIVFIGGGGMNTFRARAHLNEATHVLFRIPISAMKTKSPWMPKTEHIMERLHQGLQQCLRCIYGKFRDVQPKEAVVDVVLTVKEETHAGKRIRYVDFELRRFVFNEDMLEYQPMAMPPKRLDELVLSAGIMTDELLADTKARIGPNQICISVPWLITAMVMEYSKPFYIYQWFIFQSWYWFDYWHMGLITNVICCWGGFLVAYANRNNRAMLASLANNKSDPNAVADKDGLKPGQVEVCRLDKWTIVNATELYPGDKIKVRGGPAVCDFVLVEGACTVDESMLTGESMPIQKTEAQKSPEIYNPEGHTHKKHTVFCGTTVLDIGSTPPIAIITFTGGNTLKGVQIRSIMTPTELPFKFNTEVQVVMGILMTFAICGFVLCVILLGAGSPDVWFYGIYVVASAIPPLLPTVFVLSVEVGVGRLRTKGILCSVPDRLLMAGKVRVFCFDKTGTLTLPGLQFRGFHQIVSSKFDANLNELTTGEGESTITGINDTVLRGMASCQALSEYNGDVIGNSVDVQMFKSTEYKILAWNMIGKGDQKIELLRRFEFDPHIQLMSVVAQHPGGSSIYVKGSFEAVKSRCVDLPTDFDEMAKEYARNGCYVLALAHRLPTDHEKQACNPAIPVEERPLLNRNEVEQNLTCLGLLVYRNDLKHDTKAALQLLRDGGCRCVMITGDNALTGRFIAHAAGMVNEGSTEFHATLHDGKVVWSDSKGNPTQLPEKLAKEHELFVDGKAFNKIDNDGLLCDMLPYIRVYARMRPDDKQRAVQAHIQCNIITGMCGDGGNDCIALRAAHVGIALSDSDASVVAPFTDRNMSVMSVPAVLAEGRSSLTTSFSCYKYMVTYGILESINQLANAYFAVTFSEWSWVFLDGIFVVLLSYCIGMAKPSPKGLTKRRPTGSLLGPTTMASICGGLMIDFIFLCSALAYLRTGQPDWYTCRTYGSDPNAIRDWFALGDNYECATIFLISGSQYVHAALQFSIGGDFREAIWYNYWQVASMIAIYTLFFVVIWVPCQASCIFRVNCLDEYMTKGIIATEIAPVGNWEHSTILPHEFRVFLTVMIVVNAVINVLWEIFVVQGYVSDYIRKVKPTSNPINI